MAICCTICGQWYPQVGRDTLDICGPCWQANFHGSQELRVDAPSVAEAITLTPRQVQAMRRLHERWQARSEAARAQWEEDA